MYLLKLNLRDYIFILNFRCIFGCSLHFLNNGRLGHKFCFSLTIPIAKQTYVVP